MKQGVCNKQRRWGGGDVVLGRGWVSLGERGGTTGEVRYTAFKKATAEQSRLGWRRKNPKPSERARTRLDH